MIFTWNIRSLYVAQVNISSQRLVALRNTKVRTVQIYRIQSAQKDLRILVEARTAEESRLFGSLFLLIHRIVGDLGGTVTSEPWNASVGPCEYVPRDFFANIVPQLEVMLTDLQRGRDDTQVGARLDDVRAGDSISVTA
jgi:hypothetical protein